MAGEGQMPASGPKTRPCTRMRKHRKGDAMLSQRNAALAATMLILLAGCESVTAIGDRGCTAYAEERTALPQDADLLASPHPVVVWINETDARMTGACR